MGAVREIKPVFVCKAELESGKQVFWVDRTISPLCGRALADEMNMTAGLWRGLHGNHV